MQDRYVGDVGDFGKYGLLRALSRADRHGPALRVGIVWYLVPDEAHNNDGKHVGYLLPRSEAEYRICDPDLYDTLRHLVMTGERRVASVRAYGVFPRGTNYFESPLVLPPGRRGPARGDWFRHALAAIDGCDVVFLDPDNGLLPAGTKSMSPKHVLQAEISELAGRGQSLVLYHHLGRQGSHERQTAELLATLRERLGTDAFALRYRRGSGRVYAVVPADAHRDRLQHRIGDFVSGPWSRHFSLVTSAIGATP